MPGQWDIAWKSTAPRPLRPERVSNFARPKLSNFARSKSLTLNFGQQQVLDDLLQDGVYSLARCLGFGFHKELVLYTRKADQDNAFCFLSGGFAETPRADSRTRASRRDRPSPQWPRLLRRITPRGMACHVLLTSARRRLRLPECAGRASCRARRRSIARQIGNEGDSDARLEMQSKPSQGQMASRPFSRDEKKGNPLWDGSD